MNGYTDQHPSQQRQAMPDVETVRRNYHAALSELTFNSKPIITNLTILAQENQHAASVIVREIEQQIRNNAPGQKLPILYLIDSICKNVGGVYISHFARNIVSIYLDAYTLTDRTTRMSFERMLQTWKNGMPNGAPVFARHVIEQIERAVNYIREQQHQQGSPRRYPTASPMATMSPRNSQIHVNPNFVTKVRPPRARHESPQRKDPTPSASQVSRGKETFFPASPAQPDLSNPMISQLQSMLTAQQAGAPNSGTPAADAFTQILNQIQALLPTLPPAQASPIQQYLAQIIAATPSAATVASTPVASATPSVVASAISTPPVQYSQVVASPAMVHIAQAPHSATPTLPAASAPVNTNELLKSLASMGYLSPTPATPPSVKSTPNVANNISSIRLDSKDLQIPRPGAIEVLYGQLPLQCKQCGFRYPKTEEGQAKMDAHLDFHFRQNRRMKERVKRGLSRSWFVTEAEWISGSEGEVTSHQAPAFMNDHGTRSGNTTEKSSAHPGDEAINPDDYMVVMPEGERKPCPICGEKFVDTWNDDEEEWMYKNAVIIDNTIYHATCHADAVKSGTLVADNAAADVDQIMADVGTSGEKRKLEDEVRKENP
ncbi:uncharacterized protein BYT42DRAFT_636000 [Radiomyces spectabilis]|uniref:uncharacterized protein n=1 Tax=Radiomyces spectabilis TaxID=64574 RepID=UPI002220C55E|nr:uncharacterized protein BYT42DRAFT_636000 [Radiomyces spectabilis]KAI8379571.1 hypothetical protein BYT42DRAFT_636000 [Radiomyces spectabilis]